MKIPQTDPRAAYIEHKEEIDAAVAEVLDGGVYILGAQVSAFERGFSAYIGVSQAVAVGTGTDALFIALKACGVSYGDEIITVSHTSVATIAAIEQCGAIPIMIDIDPGSYTLDVNLIDKNITKKTKAIVAVHLYGLPVDMEAVGGLAKQHGLKVVEDCAQAHGATFKGRRVGSLSDAAAFSFYPTKNLGAFGDGGMVVTNDPGIAEIARMLRQYGWKDRYISAMKGWNSRLDEIQAAILRTKLRNLDQDNIRRRNIATVYSEILRNISLVCPVCPPDREHVYHQYVVRVKDRDTVRMRLGEMGIETSVHYPVPVHLQPAYSNDFFRLPVTEMICKEIISLPMYPQLTEEQAYCVANTFLSVLNP